ncbi:uncharacterized protein LOC133196861 [Saccostrea echinata]|uniref:uncharacterized protein LOC133196861 n=1 Tax=Saccostrea echinata TaxID=191078 RepID=UPI002A7EC7A1|nr:uncharacterized protein LOC133196861 [Saccostrea echinata]
MDSTLLFHEYTDISEMSNLEPREQILILQADLLEIKKKEMEFQMELENIERGFVSMIKHCGISSDNFPFPTPVKKTLGSPSFQFSTPGSLTRVTAISNLAEEDTFGISPQENNDQSVCDDTMVSYLSEETNTTFFFAETEKEFEKENVAERRIETSQLVPVLDVDGKKIYRVVEGCENSTKHSLSKNEKDGSCPRASSTMINQRISESATKSQKMSKQRSHPRACSTLIGRDVLVEETMEMDGSSFRINDITSSTLCIKDSVIEESNMSFFDHVDDDLANFPLTSTKISLTRNTDAHTVPDLSDSLIKISSDSTKHHKLQKKCNRHLAMGNVSISGCSTLGSMGDDSVFEKPRASQKNNTNGTKKRGLLRRQSRKTKLVDTKALIKKMKNFSNSFRSQEFRDANTLLVI